MTEAQLNVIKKTFIVSKVDLDETTNVNGAASEDNKSEINQKDSSTDGQDMNKPMYVVKIISTRKEKTSSVVSKNDLNILLCEEESGGALRERAINANDTDIMKDEIKNDVEHVNKPAENVDESGAVQGSPRIRFRATGTRTLSQKIDDSTNDLYNPLLKVSTEKNGPKAAACLVNSTTHFMLSIVQVVNETIRFVRQRESLKFLKTLKVSSKESYDLLCFFVFLCFIVNSVLVYFK